MSLLYARREAHLPRARTPSRGCISFSGPFQTSCLIFLSLGAAGKNQTKGILYPARATHPGASVADGVEGGGGGRDLWRRQRRRRHKGRLGALKGRIFILPDEAATPTLFFSFSTLSSLFFLSLFFLPRSHDICHSSEAFFQGSDNVVVFPTLFSSVPSSSSPPGEPLQSCRRRRWRWRRWRRPRAR